MSRIAPIRWLRMCCISYRSPVDLSMPGVSLPDDLELTHLAVIICLNGRVWSSRSHDPAQRQAYAAALTAKPVSLRTKESRTRGCKGSSRAQNTEGLLRIHAHEGDVGTNRSVGCPLSCCPGTHWGRNVRLCLAAAQLQAHLRWTCLSVRSFSSPILNGCTDHAVTAGDARVVRPVGRGQADPLMNNSTSGWPGTAERGVGRAGP